jgi:arylsulfatase A-like enzyme
VAKPAPGRIEGYKSKVAGTPNIVVIMTDQQRADFTRAGGFALDTTPFIDTLGRSGARFRNAYTPMPVCAPARCSLFTGRYPKATHVRQNSATGNIFRPADLVDVLRERGYRLYLAGKNHSYLRREDFDGFAAPYSHVGGPAEGKTEAEAAFDAWLKTLDGGVSPEPTPFPLACQLPCRIVRDAIALVDHADERPFFLWLSFPEPHNPYQVPEPYFSLFPEELLPDRVAGPEAAEAKGGSWRWLRRLTESKRPGYDKQWRRYRATYCGMLRLLDDQIRRFVAHLEARGVLDNTLLIFCSDHGDYAGDYGLQRKGAGLPECLVRVPLLMTGPGIVHQEAPLPEFVSLVDLMPTLCEAIGAPIPYGVQGRSLWPLLTGRDDYPPEEFRSVYAELGFGGLPYTAEEYPPLHFPYEGRRLDELNSVTQSGNLKMVRMGQWKLLFDLLGRRELYDLENDPGELRNRHDDPALRDVRLALTEELLHWTIRTEDDLPDAAYTPKRAEHNWQALNHLDDRPGGTVVLAETGGMS